MKNFDPKDNLILLCEIGSTAHGVSLPGTDDLDLMGVFIEPRECIFGLTLDYTFGLSDQKINTITKRDKGEHERSEAGDTDIVYYPLKKFCYLATKSNPSILNLFFAPIIQINQFGEKLRAAKDLFLSKKAATHYFGYLNAQKKRMMGDLGQYNVKRPELIEKYGYDTKYAYHMLRLAIQGKELLTTGEINFPMNDSWREYLLNVRQGKYILKEILQMAESFEQILKDGEANSILPTEPDHEGINNLLYYIYNSIYG